MWGMKGIQNTMNIDLPLQAHWLSTLLFTIEEDAQVEEGNVKSIQMLKAIQNTYSSAQAWCRT